MPTTTAALIGTLVVLEDEREREFELRLAESSTLAFRIAFALLRNRENAEEVAQEAFVKAYRKFAQLRDRDRFRAWLARMTWRLALDRQRADRRRLQRETEHAGPFESTPDDFVAAERLKHLRDAIDTLPEKLRIVVILSGIEGHRIREVARLLELPEGTVQSRLFRARQRLKELLQ